MALLYELNLSAGATSLKVHFKFSLMSLWGQAKYWAWEVLVNEGGRMGGLG